MSEYYAFAIKVLHPTKLRRDYVFRVFCHASFIALAEESLSNGTHARGIVWMMSPHTLKDMQKKVPTFIKVELQVNDMNDYRDLIENHRWYGKPASVTNTWVRGTWPSNELFWHQRPLPGTQADAALCYYDIRKTNLSYADIVTKYFYLWCRHPSYVDTCFHMFRAEIV